MVFTGHGPYTHSIRQTSIGIIHHSLCSVLSHIHTGIPTEITANTIIKIKRLLLFHL